MTEVDMQSLLGQFRVIPTPRKVELLGNRGLEPQDLASLQIAGTSSRPIMGPILDNLPLGKKAGKGTLLLRLLRDGLSPESKEGYLMHIKNGEVEIASKGEEGLFYGCQTLEQLLEDARDIGITIPACNIVDYPSMSYRAIHIDVKHHLDTMKYYYDSIDRLARYKINTIIFEFEDKLRYRRRPLIGAPQAISIDEMAALTRYARKRNIDISPLVQGLGHATSILKHGKYAHLREDPESRWAFCPVDDQTYDLLFDLYLDAFDATPGSRYLHVGGDEVGEIGQCPRCRSLAAQKGKMYLYLYWLNRVCRFAQSHNRIPIFWDDMIFKYAGLWETMWKDIGHPRVSQLWDKGERILDSMLELYPKNCVYMNWNYTQGRQEGNIKALEWLRKRGLDSMIATAAETSTMPLLPEDKVSVIHSFINLACEKGIDGMLCTAWDDSSPHMETYWRGLIASAEFSWNPEGRNLEEYETAYLQREFGPECIVATMLYADLSQMVLFRSKAFFEKGDLRRPEKLLSLPDLQGPGRWSKEHEALLHVAEKEAERYLLLKKQLRELMLKARRNRYHIELLTAINDFQATAAQMLLALRDCDTSDKYVRAQGMKRVHRTIREFTRSWKRLRGVYAETRFISYPKGYVRDRYFHLASQSEDLSWMIASEREFHRLVRGWLKISQQTC